MIITTAVIKGGTGKTATAAALSQVAKAEGARVLAIDLDPQANLTAALDAEVTAPGALELLNGSPAADVIQTTGQGLDVISGHRNLANERTRPGSARRLREALAPISGQYNLIIIDTPPMLGELVYNALNASDGLIIPLEADAASLQGLYQIVDVARQIMTKNPDLHILGTVITRYDNRPKINRFLRDTIAAKGDEAGAPLLATIRQGVAIREAMATRQSLTEYGPHSNQAKDYRALYAAILKTFEDF